MINDEIVDDGNIDLVEQRLHVHAPFSLGNLPLQTCQQSALVDARGHRRVDRRHGRNQGLKRTLRHPHNMGHSEKDSTGAPRHRQAEGTASPYPATSINSKQRSQPFADFEEQRVRRPSGRRDRSFLPRDAPGLVCKHDATDACTFGQEDFERITAHATGDRADHAKAGDGIVTSRRYDDGRSSAALFVSGRGVQIDPDDIPGFGTIVTRLRCQRPAPNRSHRDGWPA